MTQPGRCVVMLVESDRIMHSACCSVSDRRWQRGLMEAEEEKEEEEEENTYDRR